MEVIVSLAKKYKISIALSKKKGRKYEGLSEEQIYWLKELIDRSERRDNPGKRDHFCIGKFEVKF